LNARQRPEASGLRQENEPPATKATLPQPARTVLREDASANNARNVRHATKRTKHFNAGRPELAQSTCIDAKPESRDRRVATKKMPCRLTLELSGGEAVRLE